VSVAAFVSMRRAEPVGPRAQALQDYERTLVDAGVPAELLPRFGPITTTSVVSGPDKLSFDQQIPSLNMRRHVRIAVYQDQQLDLQGLKRIETTHGYDLYLLRHETKGFLGGFHVVLAYFLPYESTPQDVLNNLGVKRLARRRTPEVLPVSFVAAPPSLLGVVVSTVTTTTDTGGFGSTSPGPGAAIPAEAPDLTSLGPGADVSMGGTDPRAPLPTAPWFESPEGRQWIQEMNEFIRQQQGASHPDAEFARAEEMARDVEQALERNRQQALNRAGQVLTGLQAANELLRQYLDGRDMDAALRAARDCHNNPTNPLARRAQSEDRENYDRALEQINDAQAENDGDMWVRRLNTANNAVGGAAIPGAAGLGFGALGTVTSNADATLRSLQIERTRDAVRGVTRCDPPPPCPDPAPEAAPAPSTQNYTPGLSRVAPAAPAPGPVCRPSQASIVVNAREDDGRTITFRSIVNLTQSSTNFQDFRGTGTGPYREHFASDQCPFTITWTGEVGVEVVARREMREVEVAIAGPVTQAGEWPGESCRAGTYYAPYPTDRPVSRLEYSCRFDNVNFVHGGSYRSPPPQEGCALSIGPLISPTETPGR
jgi:hypothetical protein